MSTQSSGSLVRVVASSARNRDHRPGRLGELADRSRPRQHARRGRDARPIRCRTNDRRADQRSPFATGQACLAAVTGIQWRAGPLRRSFLPANTVFRTLVPKPRAHVRFMPGASPTPAKPARGSPRAELGIELVWMHRGPERAASRYAAGSHSPSASRCPSSPVRRCQGRRDFVARSWPKRRSARRAWDRKCR